MFTSLNAIIIWRYYIKNFKKSRQTPSALGKIGKSTTKKSVPLSTPTLNRYVSALRNLLLG